MRCWTRWVSCMLEFSPQGYRQLLAHIVASGYACPTFSQWSSSATVGLCCLLRHDVDVNLEFAVRMAAIEHDMGLNSTYFVMFRSPLYNLMSRHGAASLAKIREFGHQIALHFDCDAVSWGERDVEEWLDFELDMLAFILGERVTAFSLHQPSVAVIDRRISRPGVINTYHPEHMFGLRYLSDSNRDWRGRDPLQEIQRANGGLQLLTHPMWWMCDGDIPNCWNEAILSNIEHAQRQLLATERAYGPAREFRVTVF